MKIDENMYIDVKRLVFFYTTFSPQLEVENTVKLYFVNYKLKIRGMFDLSSFIRDNNPTDPGY